MRRIAYREIHAALDQTWHEQEHRRAKHLAEAKPGELTSIIEHETTATALALCRVANLTGIDWKPA